MNSSAARRKVVMPLLVAFAVLYLFGMHSDFAVGALLVISVSVLYLALSSVLQGARAAQETRDASEQTYRHAGRNFRVFVDEQGEIWLRASDIKRVLDHDYSNAVLERRYPSRFGLVHPHIDAWYMHHSVLRDFLGMSGRDNVRHFLDWFSSEVIGMSRFRWGQTTTKRSASTTQIRALPQRHFLLNWFIRHWRGEVGLMSAVLGGAGVVGSASLAVHLLNEPVDMTLHYRLSALLYVTQLAVASGGMYWWGRGVLHSTQRWIASERSLLAALLTSVLGFGSVLYGLSSMVDTEKQYFLTDFFTILLDADHKPQVRFDPTTDRIRLDGELGFGTTNQVRKLLAQHPQTRSIELKSYGGRTSEGFALMMLIAQNKLQTYVQAECMSACVYAYLGGWPRHVAISAKFGLHRSGFSWKKGEKERNSIDEAFASNMRSMGVDETFINRGLVPSIHEIYMPSAKEVLDAGLATTEWVL